MSFRGLRPLSVLPLLLALAACAGAPAPVAKVQDGVAVGGQPVAVATAPEPAPADVPPPPEAVAATADAGAAPPPAADAATDAIPTTGAATAAEDDYAALYGEAPPAGDGTIPAASAVVPYDPWQPLNRRIHAFNNVIDRAVARPIARAYVSVVPQPVRLGVTNFFDNLGSPLTFLNQVLQGRPRDAVQTLGRFVVNSTLGIGGVFDPASDLKMKRRSEDFGQTLGIWGWRSSRYLELPFFGPRTMRDVVGLAGDAPLSVTPRIEEDRVRVFLQGLQLVDTRAQLLALDALRDAAPDEYAITRDAWLKRRTFQIESDRRNRPQDSDLPDYLREDEEEERNPIVPANAMPIPVTVP